MGWNTPLDPEQDRHGRQVELDTSGWTGKGADAYRKVAGGIIYADHPSRAGLAAGALPADRPAPGRGWPGS